MPSQDWNIGQNSSLSRMPLFSNFLIRVFHDKIKFNTLKQNLHQMGFDVSETNPSPKCEMVHKRNFS